RVRRRTAGVCGTPSLHRERPAPELLGPVADRGPPRASPLRLPEFLPRAARPLRRGICDRIEGPEGPRPTARDAPDAGRSDRPRDPGPGRGKGAGGVRLRRVGGLGRRLLGASDQRHVDRSGAQGAPIAVLLPDLGGQPRPGEDRVRPLALAPLRGGALARGGVLLWTGGARGPRRGDAGRRDLGRSHVLGSRVRFALLGLPGSAPSSVPAAGRNARRHGLRHGAPLPDPDPGNVRPTRPVRVLRSAGTPVRRAGRRGGRPRGVLDRLGVSPALPAAAVLSLAGGSYSGAPHEGHRPSTSLPRAPQNRQRTLTTCRSIVCTTLATGACGPGSPRFAWAIVPAHASGSSTSNDGRPRSSSSTRRGRAIRPRRTDTFRSSCSETSSWITVSPAARRTIRLRV